MFASFRSRVDPFENQSGTEDADATPNPGGLPVGGVTIVRQPNSHLQYAVTWFGLAAALAGVVGVWLLRSKKSG